MPRSNLARVMAPTLVAAVPMTDMDSAVKDSKRSTKVMEVILSLPPSYWSNIMSPGEEGCSSPTGVGYSGEDPATPGTPEMLRGRNRPIRTRNLGHVTGYQPIRDQYFLSRWGVVLDTIRYLLSIYLTLSNIIPIITLFRSTTGNLSATNPD